MARMPSMIFLPTPTAFVVYKVAGGLVPVFWGRRVENAIAEATCGSAFDVVHSQWVRQGFYPFRVMIARM